MSFVMTPPAVSKPIDKEVTSKSSKSCTCEDPSPVRMATMVNSTLRNHVLRPAIALVGLLRILRVAELSASPRPAPTAPEKAHVLRQIRRKRPRPPTLPHDPQKCARAQGQNPQPATPRQPKTRRAPERARQNSLHIERLAALRWRWRRLSRAQPTSSSGVSRLGDGGRGRYQETGRGRVRQGERPSHHRSWTRSPQHRGPQRPGLRVQRARRRRQVAASRLKTQKASPCPRYHQQSSSLRATAADGQKATQSRVSSHRIVPSFAIPWGADKCDLQLLKFHRQIVRGVHEYHWYFETLADLTLIGRTVPS